MRAAGQTHTQPSAPMLRNQSEKVCYRGNEMNDLSHPPYLQPQIEVSIAPASARIGAYLLNVLFNIIAMLPLIIAAVYAFSGSAPSLKNLDPNNPEAMAAALSSVFGHPAFLAGLAVYAVYGIWQIFMMSKHGQSLGKRMLKIKVIKTNGNEAGFLGTVLLREIAFGIASSVIVGLLIGIAGALAGSARAAELLGDLISLLPTIICFAMLFLNKNRDRRTLQDYVADTVVVKLPPR